MKDKLLGEILLAFLICLFLTAIGYIGINQHKTCAPDKVQTGHKVVLEQPPAEFLEVNSSILVYVPGNKPTSSRQESKFQRQSWATMSKATNF